MEKRYQVFVSSTFADLQEERSKVIQTLMEMDCIPAGMELFPAIDDEQFNFIKRIIDDCDYYLLIIGGRYGSLSEDGISYTEMEYDYAIEKDMKVIALIHNNPDAIASGKTDNNQELREKLEAFKKKVSTNRLVKYWENIAELPGAVALSLQKTIKTYPAVGWVRGSKTSSSELLAELNELRKENQTLKEKLSKKVDEPSIENLAGLEDDVTLYIDTIDSKNAFRVKTSWGEIFQMVSPVVHRTITNGYFTKIILNAIGVLGNIPTEEITNISPNVNNIKIQFSALNLVELSNNEWQLTQLGKLKMQELLSIKKKK